MADFQAEFSGALLDAARGIPTGLKAPDGGSADRRFAVYRNNVAVSLVNALADIFPSIQSLVGEDYFRAMARVFVKNNPPRSPLLFEYGRNFPDFIEAFEPARKLPFLADTARLERLWLDAFHAADMQHLDGAALAAVPQETLADIRFIVHPAAHLLRSEYAVMTIVARSRQAQSLDGFDPYHAEYGLVTRPDYDPMIYNLPLSAFAFAGALFGGSTLGEAAAEAAEAAPEFDLSQALTMLLSAGAFTDITTGRTGS